MYKLIIIDNFSEEAYLLRMQHQPPSKEGQVITQQRAKQIGIHDDFLHISRKFLGKIIGCSFFCIYQYSIIWAGYSTIFFSQDSQDICRGHLWQYHSWATTGTCRRIVYFSTSTAVLTSGSLQIKKPSVSIVYFFSF